MAKRGIRSTAEGLPPALREDGRMTLRYQVNPTLFITEFDPPLQNLQKDQLVHQFQPNRTRNFNDEGCFQFCFDAKPFMVPGDRSPASETVQARFREHAEKVAKTIGYHVLATEITLTDPTKR